MLTLSVIALASGLAFTPAQPGPYSTASVVRSERARATLNQMTSVAQSSLRAKNIEEALNSGIRTFKMALDQQLSDQTAQEVVVVSVPESHKSVTIK